MRGFKVKDNRRRILEDELEISLDELGAGGGGRIFEILRHSRESGALSRIIERFEAHYRDIRQVKTFDQGELVPYVTPMFLSHPDLVDGVIEVNYPAFGDTKRTLLYAHKIVVQEPILLAPDLSSISGAHSSQVHAAAEAIYYWCEFYPLIEEGILTVVEPSRTKDFTTLFHEVRRSPAISSIIESLTPEEESILTSDWDSGVMQDERPKHFISDLLLGIEGVRGHPGASHWFSSKMHLDLYVRVAGLADCRLQGPRGEMRRLASVVSLDLLDPKSLSTSDVVTLRRNSEAFSSWRETLRAALEDMAETVDEDVDDTALLQELRATMTQAARKTEQEIKRAKRDTGWAAFRSVSFGALSGAAGGAIDGITGILSGTIGAVLEGGFDAGRDVIELREKVSAKRAYVRHAIAVGDGHQTREASDP